MRVFNETEIIKSNNSINNDFFIKRDDLIPFSFGGNKVRKSLLYYEDIKKKKSDYIITYGSSSSNHGRIISNIAVMEDIPCIIIIPEESNKDTFNSKLIKLFGAKIVTCPLDKVKDCINDTILNVKNEGYNPYFIQGGGHGNIGTRAYLQCYEEILSFERKSNIFFDYIFHASGTGTTQAGLVCGQILNKDYNRKIIGISIARKNPYGGSVVLNSVNEFMKLNNCCCDDYSKYINFTDKYICGGYGKYDDFIVQTIKSEIKKDGIPLDSTYTGKAFTGMVKYLEENNISGKKVLFIHTGGTPLFFDDML